MAAAAQVGGRLRFLLALFLLALPSSAVTFYVTVTGLGGTPEYQAQFAKWSKDLAQGLEKNASGASVKSLAGNAATLEAIRGTLAQVAAEAKPQDSFALFLIGHGTFDGTDYKFNIPGPDISARDLAGWLDKISAAHQLIVNMTSCSGASIPALSRKGRIVITATKSGTEKNAPVFARYWIEGMQDPAADSDKNGTISTLELYRYTAQKTAAYFDSEKLLATEHPTLTDAPGTSARHPGAENGQGLLAARFPIIRPESETARDLPPGKQDLLSHKENLEGQIDRLKYRKTSLPFDQYRQQLTVLLLDLARTQSELDR